MANDSKVKTVENLERGNILHRSIEAETKTEFEDIMTNRRTAVENQQEKNQKIGLYLVLIFHSFVLSLIHLKQKTITKIKQFKLKMKK